MRAEQCCKKGAAQIGRFLEIGCVTFPAAPVRSVRLPKKCRPRGLADRKAGNTCLAPPSGARYASGGCRPFPGAESVSRQAGGRIAFSAPCQAPPHEVQDQERPPPVRPERLPGPFALAWLLDAVMPLGRHRRDRAAREETGFQGRNRQSRCQIRRAMYQFLRPLDAGGPADPGKPGPK